MTPEVLIKLTILQLMQLVLTIDAASHNDLSDTKYSMSLKMAMTLFPCLRQNVIYVNLLLSRTFIGVYRLPIFAFAVERRVKVKF